MRALFLGAAGVLFFTSAVFAQSYNAPMDIKPRILKHKPKTMARQRAEQGTSAVVVGSDVRATSEGEVIVPPMSIIDVQVQPAPATPNKAAPTPPPPKP